MSFWIEKLIDHLIGGWDLETQSVPSYPGITTQVAG